MKAMFMSRYLLMHFVKDKRHSKKYCSRFQQFWNGQGKENTLFMSRLVGLRFLITRGTERNGTKKDRHLLKDGDVHV